MASITLEQVLGSLPSGTGDAALAGYEDGDAVIVDPDEFATQDELDALVISGGGISVASQAEALAGSNNTKAMTPTRVKDVMPGINVWNYGAVGDGSTSDTAAIGSAITAAAALVNSASGADKQIPVNLMPGKNYRAVGLSVPNHVVLKGNGSKIQGNGAGTIVTLADTKAELWDTTIWGATASTVSTGVHLTSTGYWKKVLRCSFDSLGGSAILSESIGSWIHDVLAYGCVTNDAALASPTGVLHLDTTDNWVQNCELNASNQAGMSASGKAYAVVLEGGTHMLNNVVAELSDHGFYVDSTETRLIGCRADLNRGHGFVLSANSGGSLVGCLALRNSNETTNTYDGYNFANGSNWQVDGCRAVSLSVDAWKHRWGFNDATSGLTNNNRFGPTNRSSNHTTGAISVSSSSGSHVMATNGPVVAVAAAATTFSVQPHGWPSTNFALSSVAPVNMTNFTNGVDGQRITIRGDGQTTFVHDGVNIFTNTFGNVLSANFKMYDFVRIGSAWFQML
jgi:hypothetical protein